MAKRELTEEQRAELRERMQKAREAAKAKRAAKEVVPHSGLTDQPNLDNEQAPVAAGAAPLSERRARLLEGVDPDTAALLTDARIAEIEAEENKRALEERTKLAEVTLRAALRQKAQIEHDLISPDVLLDEDAKKRRQEPVRFRVILPDDGAGDNRRAGYRVNNFLYEHGKEYVRPRAIAESIISNLYQTWLWETRFTMLNQQKSGKSAQQIMAQHSPQFVIEDAHA